jgi:hypothetical protein
MVKVPVVDSSLHHTGTFPTTRARERSSLWRHVRRRAVLKVDNVSHWVDELRKALQVKRKAHPHVKNWRSAALAIGDPIIISVAFVAVTNKTTLFSLSSLSESSKRYYGRIALQITCVLNYEVVSYTFHRAALIISLATSCYLFLLLSSIYIYITYPIVSCHCPHIYDHIQASLP